MAGGKVTIDTELKDGVSKKLKGISRAFDMLGGKGSGASLFGNVGAGAVAKGFDLISSAASVAIGFATDSVDAFSNLEQATGGLESVFGDSSKTIENFADTSAESFGISRRAAFEMATVIGAKLQGMGFDVDTAAKTVIELEKRGADMAATFGGTATDAIASISSALTGERDAIEKYGVSIKEADVKARILALGLDTSTAAALKESTAIATLDLIMEQTTPSVGAFAKETDTLAGSQAIANAKMEDAQAALGQKLAPIFQTFTAWMISDGIPALEGLVDILIGVNEWVGNVEQGFRDAAEAVARFIDRAKEALGLPVHTVRIPSQSRHTPGGDNRKGYASGGWAGMQGPEMVMVGEQGPEYIRRAGQGQGPGGGGGGHGHDIILDGERVGRAVGKTFARDFRRAALTTSRV